MSVKAHFAGILARMKQFQAQTMNAAVALPDTTALAQQVAAVQAAPGHYDEWHGRVAQATSGQSQNATFSEAVQADLTSTWANFISSLQNESRAQLRVLGISEVVTRASTLPDRPIVELWAKKTVRNGPLRSIRSPSPTGSQCHTSAH